MDTGDRASAPSLGTKYYSSFGQQQKQAETMSCPVLHDALRTLVLLTDHPSIHPSTGMEPRMP